MTAEVGVVMPYWLDRPDQEALEIAVAAEGSGIGTAWIGEMVSFDAFALATAIGLRTTKLRLKLGPLALGVRSPAAIALGVASVATLTDHPVDVALGASSPVIVSGWHDRPWNRLAQRAEETVLALRALLDGERAGFDGQVVRCQGFRLRHAQRETSIAVAAFGPRMTEVAARHADEVVLNLVTPDHVAQVRRRVDEVAKAAGRDAPRLSVWVPAALEPGPDAIRQLQGQLAVYLGAPGYGELFSRIGFEPLVASARSGARRSELAEAIPAELIAAVGAIGTADQVLSSVAAYHEAGADHVGLVPSTAEDPAGRGVMAAVAHQVVS